MEALEIAVLARLDVPNPYLTSAPALPACAGAKGGPDC